ncbi:MAG: universal stress protein [Opitutaceae bacterium]|nr:universal stress protein [Cytophagales bacterium]
MKSILVPTDYSESAHHALNFAFLLGENVPVKIFLFHWTEILIPTSTPQHMYKELYDEQRQVKYNNLKKDTILLLENLSVSKENINLEYIIGDGSGLEEALLIAVKDNNIDVVVMGTLGASGIKKLFVGSNTAKIIEKAKVPVIAVPANFQFGPINKIGYASDLNDVKNEIGELVQFAKLFNATIEIFHVYPTFPVFFEVNQENVDNLIAELVAKYPGQKFTLHVVQTYKDNDIVYGIEKYIKDFKPDMLAMFTLKRSFWDKLFDASKTEEIAFNTNVPLLTLKKTDQ